MVAGVALLLCIQIIRNAAVDALAKTNPDAAARLWKAHPAVQISYALKEIGLAARAGRPVPVSIFAEVDEAAAKSPLSAEPYLVHGVQAQMSGDADRARRAFLAAQWRDPRSLPAAYFLAEYYFRNARPLQGLEQTAVLARLSPQGIGTIAPFVAAYARERANWPQIRALFRSQEGLEDGVLAALAGDAGNVDALLAVADSRHRRADSPWLPVLLNSLVADGKYTRARSVWASVSGAKMAPGALIYDPGFSSPEPPPPFNWTLTATNVGLAERQPGQRLHVIFYGNQDGVLARQLLLLRPGKYQLQMKVFGSPAYPEALRWSIRCDKASEPIAIAPLPNLANRGLVFEVRGDCPAQWIELTGRAGDVAQQSDVTMGALSLTRAGGNA